MNAGVEQIRPALEARGFRYADGEEGVSSGGSFAVAFFRRDALEIGLIVRSKSQLGCPNYSDGRGYAGHDDLMWALDAQLDAQLVAGQFLTFRSRTGGEPFEAYRADLEGIVLRALDASETEFRKALRRAVNRARAAIGLPPVDGSA